MSSWLELIRRPFRAVLADQHADPTPPPGSWKARYIRDAEHYLRADRDPFEGWEKIKVPHHLVRRELQSALDVAFGGGDLKIYRRYLDRALLKAERIRRDGLPENRDRHSDLDRFELGEAQCDEAYARLLRDGTWDMAVFSLGLEQMAEWCFDKHSNPRWDDFTKEKALELAPRAVVASKDELFAKLLKRMSKMSEIRDLDLWRAVAETTSPARGASLIQRCLAQCSKGYDNTPLGNPTYQFELAVSIWVLRGNPLEAVSIDAVVKIVYGQDAD